MGKLTAIVHPGNRLTHFSPLKYSSRDGKDRKHFSNDLDNYFLHFCRRCDFRIGVKTPEEFLYFAKEFSECALTTARTSAKSLNRLKDMDVIIAHTKQ